MKKIKLKEQKQENSKPDNTKNHRVSQSQEDNTSTVKSIFNKKNLKIAILSIALLVLVASSVFAYNRWQKNIENSFTADGEQRAESCTDLFNPDCWTEAFKPKLQRSEDNKTNVLLVGIDTRESGSGAGLRNTDTVILGTIDHDNNQTRMISFPRDLYAPWGCPGSNLPFKIRINAILANGQIRCGEDQGIETLKQSIEFMTGVEIQYHALVRLEGVTRAIDEIGGITIEVESDYTDVYPYNELSPEKQDECRRWSQNYGYCLFTFEKGTHQLSGEEALIYARMRKLSAQGDFDRGRRQQQIISAFKDKIIGQDTPLDQKANNLWNTYNTLSQYIDTNFGLEDILAGLDFATNELDKEPLKIVVDQQFAGGGVIYPGQGSLFNFRDYTFTELQDELEKISENPELYRERAEVYAVNYTGSGWTNENPAIATRNSDLWFIDIVTNTLTRPADATEKTGVEIIDFTNGDKNGTVEYFKNEFENLNTSVSVKTPEDYSDTEMEAPTPSTFFAEGEDIRINIYSLGDNQSAE